LVALAHHALDTHAVPDTHHTPARLIITLDHHTLRAHTPSGTGVSGDGLDLPPGVLRRLACDAEIVPAVLGARGEVLDVGRTTRTVTTGLWHALMVRDRHCTFPACTRPPAMCQAHHLQHWADGGTTALDNLALLCGHHHRVIHHTPWQTRINPHDRQPEYSPPPRPSQQRHWTRHRPRLERAAVQTTHDGLPPSP
jgi:Domain of unknown function (DUF222)/HNH endonuclease